MSNLPVKQNITPHELALVQNDLSKLNPEERLSLYNKTCESLGLNPLTQPFGYIEFRGGKLSLYAKKDATDQLRSIHGVSVTIASKETIGDNFVVMAKAKDASGRFDEDMGSVSIKGLSGDALGNAMMKAITKAKRRVTLSICGLGLLDESEVETVPDAKIRDVGGSENAPKTNEPKEIPKKPEESKQTIKPIVNHAPKTSSDIEYRTNFTFGNWPKGMALKELGSKGVSDMQKTILIWTLKEIEKGKKIPPQIQEFLDQAKSFLEDNKV